ncbi:MAG: Gfo/Idh/MocA family oxidoreductase [Spirochaetales bacterium]|nr:Gfo/Idh/MocA family oxidoreductase [Spirochaetales bacterium]
MEDKTNLAIIGYGFMGEIYRNACIELYSQEKIETYYKYNLPGILKGFKLKAIVDTKFTNTNYLEADGIWYFNSIEEMVKHDDLHINTAVVSTPIKTHFEIAKKLILCNISLLIEKPVCETAKEVKGLISISKKHNVKIMPGHVERYNPVTLDAAESVKYKMYGKILSYSFLRTSSKPERVEDNLIIDKLIHDLDLVQCIFGKYRISDIKFKKVDNEIMECTVSTIHKKGYQGEIVSSWLSENKTREITIKFERGLLKGDLIKKKINVDRYMELSKQISGYKNNQIKDQLVDFIAYKHRLIKTLVNMKDALQAAQLIDEIIRRAENEI